jgi:hypothetical protein
LYFARTSSSVWLCFGLEEHMHKWTLNYSI